MASFGSPTSSSSSSFSVGINVASTWEELIRNARRLESILFSRVGEVSRLNARIAKERMSAAAKTTSSNNTGGGGAGAGAGAGAGSASDVEAATTKPLSLRTGQGIRAAFAPLEAAVEQAVNQLNETLEQMQMHIRVSQAEEGSSAGAGGGGRGRDRDVHILQRSRTVMHDQLVEFRRNKEAIMHQMHKAELLSDADSKPFDPSTNTDTLLREKTGLHDSLRAIEEVVMTANTSHGSLVRQRGLLQGVGAKLQSLLGKFPTLDNVIGKIQRHQQRDTIILAFVIACCFAFTVIYLRRR